MTTPKGTQQPRGKNKKGKDKKGGGNNNKNEKSDANVGGAKKEKKKVKFPCNICSEDHLTHQCPNMEEAQCLLVQQQPVVLKNPFPQGNNMQVGSSGGNPQGGTQNAPLSDGTMSFINMVNHKKEDIDLLTKSHDYGNPESTSKGKETSNPQNSLHIEKPEKETMSCILKGVYKHASHNPNARVMPNYSIVEDLAQMPCAMSSLEVLQSFPSQRAALLSTIGATDSSSQLVMKFNATDVKPHFPYHVSFQINIVYEKHIIGRIVIDEGASTCVMSLSCWKSIGSPELTLSPMLLTTFDG
jgi:hypothetical protein